MRPLIGVALASAVWMLAEESAAQPAAIRSLESEAVFHSQFNPKEIQVTQTVPWKKHRSSRPDAPTLEFTDAEPRTLLAELDFDSSAGGTDVHQAIAPLEQLALVDPALERPPLVQFEWGGFPVFKGVIESVDVKYTLFLPNGTPVRATASIGLKEAARVRGKGNPGDALACKVPADCPSGQSCFNGTCAPGR